MASKCGLSGADDSKPVLMQLLAGETRVQLPEEKKKKESSKDQSKKDNYKKEQQLMKEKQE